jgi:hypothetical protein
VPLYSLALPLLPDLSLAYWHMPSALWMEWEGTPAGGGSSFCEYATRSARIDGSEGILTVCVGVASYWIIVDFAQDAKFLTEDEKAWVMYVPNKVSLTDSYKQQVDASQYGEAEHFSTKSVSSYVANVSL